MTTRASETNRRGRIERIPHPGGLERLRTSTPPRTFSRLIENLEIIILVPSLLAGGKDLGKREMKQRSNIDPRLEVLREQWFRHERKRLYSKLASFSSMSQSLTRGGAVIKSSSNRDQSSKQRMVSGHQTAEGGQTRMTVLAAHHRKAEWRGGIGARSRVDVTPGMGWEGRQAPERGALDPHPAEATKGRMVENAFRPVEWPRVQGCHPNRTPLERVRRRRNTRQRRQMHKARGSS